MSKSGSEMTFEEFQAMLAEELMLPAAKLTPDANLVEDLQVDSLALASMMLSLEKLGISIPIERAWEIETVGDAYNAYVEGLKAGNKHG